MKVLFIFGLLACAAAAPQYFHERPFHHHPHHPPPHPPHHSSLENHFRDDGFFDAAGFWGGLEAEMERLEDMLNDFSKQFPAYQSTAGIVGNEYVLTVPLTGFDVKDVAVKAREGLVMIQAVHHYEDGSQKTYMDLRTLPANVNPSGTWIYEKDVLKVMFPLTKKPDSTEVVTESENVTTAPKTSREHMEPSNENVSQDADVGLENENTNAVDEIYTNVIPNNNVEATTYAVDLKNEVEFVPVKY